MTWKRISKDDFSKRSGKFAGIVHKLAIIIKKDGAGFYITPKAFDALGQPRCVEILEGGDGKLAFIPSSDELSAFVVGKATSPKSVRSIACKQYASERGISDKHYHKVYTGTQGMLFNKNAVIIDLMNGKPELIS